MLEFDTLLAARDAIRAKDISSSELTREALVRIDHVDKTILASLTAPSPPGKLHRARQERWMMDASPAS